jgi:hypothetical protein
MATVGVPSGKSVPKVTKNLGNQQGPAPIDLNKLDGDTSHVYKPASSNLMAGMSQNRGKGGAK